MDLWFIGLWFIGLWFIGLWFGHYLSNRSKEDGARRDESESERHAGNDGWNDSKLFPNASM